MSAASILRQAASIVDGRRRTYGDPIDHLQRVARRWSITLGVTVTAHQVALCMIDMKQERLRKDPRHADSKKDIAGYAAIMAELDRTITTRKSKRRNRK